MIQIRRCGRFLRRVNANSLVGVDLSGAVLRNADLNHARLTKAILTRADLSGASMSGADLSEAGLCSTNLSRAHLSYANLTDADLNWGDLRSAFLWGAKLIRATLSNADLSGADLHRADLSGAKLSGADLTDADLSHANLTGATLCYAKLFGTDLTDADLSGADLSHANMAGAMLNDAKLTMAILRHADLSDADLTGAELSDAYLGGAFLAGTNLRHADLSGANLTETHMRDADLNDANLDCAVLLEAVFAGVSNLHLAKNLDKVIHGGPSTLDRRTLQNCIHALPDVFLEGCGHTRPEIDYQRATYRQGLQFYSCFVSRADADAEFGERLVADLRAQNVSCWHYTQDMLVGRQWEDQIDRAIKVYEKLLLVCSERSVYRPNVVSEIYRAIDEERATATKKLFPICLDRYLFGKEMKAAGKEAAERFERLDNWVSIVTKNHIADFSGWRDHDAYKREFSKLLRGLRRDPAI